LVWLGTGGWVTGEGAGLAIGSDATAGLFHFAPFVFGFEDFLLETTWAWAGLAAFFFAFVLLRQAGLAPLGLDLIAEFHACPVAIAGLGAFALAADLDAAGRMAQDDGGGGLVDFLATRTGATDEGLAEVIVEDAQFFEALLQRSIEIDSSHGEEEFSLKMKIGYWKSEQSGKGEA
jgi:hypothetical protein